MKLRAIIKAPEERYGHVTYISDTPENLQKHVGGIIDPVTYTNFEDNKRTFVILCNDDGRLIGLKKNCIVELPANQEWGIVYPIGYVGTIIVLGVDGEKFANCPLTFDEWKKMVKEAKA